MLAGEISEFNKMIDECLDSLSKYFSKGVIDSIRNYPTEDDLAHDRYVSFDTKVKVLNDFFVERAEKIDKKMLEFSNK